MNGCDVCQTRAELFGFVVGGLLTVHVCEGCRAQLAREATPLGQFTLFKRIAKPKKEKRR